MLQNDFGKLGPSHTGIETLQLSSGTHGSQRKHLFSNCVEICDMITLFVQISQLSYHITIQSITLIINDEYNKYYTFNK